jgi:G:T-mismatch repair DNA endonuclease (very short patch repair protein)
LEGNRARDLLKLQELQSLGWSAFIIWECQLRNGDVQAVARSIIDFNHSALAIVGP